MHVMRWLRSQIVAPRQNAVVLFVQGRWGFQLLSEWGIGTTSDSRSAVDNAIADAPLLRRLHDVYEMSAYCAHLPCDRCFSRLIAEGFREIHFNYRSAELSPHMRETIKTYRVRLIKVNTKDLKSATVISQGL